MADVTEIGDETGCTDAGIAVDLQRQSMSLTLSE